MRIFSLPVATSGQAFLAGLGYCSQIFPTALATHSGWSGLASETSDWDALCSDWGRVGSDFEKARDKAREIQERHGSAVSS